MRAHEEVALQKWACRLEKGASVGERVVVVSDGDASDAAVRPSRCPVTGSRMGVVSLQMQLSRASQDPGTTLKCSQPAPQVQGLLIC